MTESEEGATVMPLDRRGFLLSAGAACLLAACSSGSSSPALAPGPAAFDPTKFVEKTGTVSTASGDKRIAYRLFSAIPYVGRPVDARYQSLSIAVPTAVNGMPVDASRAPILFEIPVGGYMSSAVSQDPFVSQAPGGGAPPGGAPAGGSGGAPTGAGSMGQNLREAAAAGWVVVSVGARGRDNRAADGTYFGKAPAAIVDLKAAVRFLRANRGRVPGDTDRIVSDGTSAGGALSMLLGVSGDSPLYAQRLAELGAADASDAIHAVAAYCPITDLEHADGAYEFLYRTLTKAGSTIDPTVSGELSAAFVAYQDGLRLQGLDRAPLTAARYPDYLLRTYLQPAATTYLAGLSAADRTAYLAANPGITFAGGRAEFTFPAYLSHLGKRTKAQPAFDAFDLSAGENNEFGSSTVDNRHFTEYSARRTGSTLDADIPGLLRLMNPMPFIAERNPGRAHDYFLRVGTSDTDTASTVVANLAAALTGAGDRVDSLMYWDKGHAVNADPGVFMSWAERVTGRPG